MSKSEHGAAVDRGNRPLSPHLQVYRPQITSVLSIFHRVTGVGNSIGAVLVAWWFIAAATGREAFSFIDGLLTSWVGHAILIGFAFSLCYHLCNGVRHLLWDAGYGFEIEEATLSGYIMLISAGILAVGLIVIGATS